MPKLYISEFAQVADQSYVSGPAPTVGLPEAASQVVTFATSTASAAFGATTRLVRIQADADCHIKVGSDPAATTSDMPLVAGAPEYFGVTPGQKIAAIQAA